MSETEGPCPHGAYIPAASGMIKEAHTIRCDAVPQLGKKGSMRDTCWMLGVRGKSLSGFLEGAWRHPVKGRWKGTSPEKRNEEQVQSSDGEKGCGKI